MALGTQPRRHGKAAPLTPNPTTLAIISGWVTHLADLTAHSDGKPSKDAIAAYATVLGQTFPSAAFTAESLAYAVEGREWFPAVSVVSAAVRDWWNQHKPQCAAAITDQRTKPIGWEEADQRWVDFWFKRREEIRGLEDPRQGTFQGERLVSLIRCQSPRAAEFLGWDKPVVKPANEAEADAILARVHRATRPPAAPHGENAWPEQPSAPVSRPAFLTREQILVASGEQRV